MKRRIDYWDWRDDEFLHLSFTSIDELVENLLNQNSRILLLDEKYSNLSAAYVPTFYTFIESFCSQNNFIIIMISHIDNQIEHADKVYYLNDGVITEEKEVEQKG